MIFVRGSRSSLQLQGSQTEIFYKESAITPEELLQTPLLCEQALAQVLPFLLSLVSSLPIVSSCPSSSVLQELVDGKR